MLNVLVFIEQAVKAWTIPAAKVEWLRSRFPDITFVHATDTAQAVRAIAGADVAFTWRLTPEMLAAAARLRWVHSSAVAVGYLRLPELAARGVLVTNSRGIQSGPIADHVLGSLLVLARRFHECLRAQDERRWIQNDLVGDRAPRHLEGRRLLLVGLGTIGEAVALRARAFGMRVTAIRRRPERGAPPGVNAVHGPAALDGLLPDADVLVLAAPLTGETRDLIGEAQLARMSHHSILINVGRGQSVDEAALAAALRGGRIGGAALDVFHDEPLDPRSPLWDAPNLLITPHTSGFRADHWDHVIELFAANLHRFMRGEPLLNPVDLEAGY